MDEGLNVKIGDEVMVISRWRKDIVKVTKVTPKGFIRTSDNGYYDNRGRNKNSDPWDATYIMEVTEELRKEFYESVYIKETINILRDLKSIGYNDATKIREILKV